jgi:hypothetical protein
VCLGGPELTDNSNLERTDLGTVSLNYLPGFALIDARAGWQPAITGMMDAAYFAGFWLRHQRIGTRFV